jgi:hypothetical protein
MPLYLDEIWLKWDSPERAKQVLTQFRGMGTGDFAFPKGVTLQAGPWFSNEERKIVLVLALAYGLIERRRLAPIVAWEALDDVISRL